MNKLVRALVALALAATALVLLGPASAAEAYPPTQCASISISTTHPAVGETITVSGINFAPHHKVKIVLHTKTYVLGVATTDAKGSFTIDVKLPSNVVGNHIIDAVGGAPSCPPNPIQITVSGSGSSVPPSGGPGPGGGPAFTGLDIFALLAAAVLLVTVGTLLNKRGRRHRHAHTD